MDIFSYTGKGQRKINEDFYANVKFDESTSLHIVADGMGGYSYGDVAARTAIEAIVKHLYSKYHEQDAEKIIQESLEIANEQILQKQITLQAKLGTTIAGVFIREHTGYAFWLGDVQIYHFRNHVLIFISESHSLVNEMRKSKVLMNKDIERFSSIVTKSLSGNGLTRIPIAKLELSCNDTISICSDGFYRENDVDKFICLSDQKRMESLENNFQIAKDNYTAIFIGITK